MEFKIGGKVTITNQLKKFYKNMYKLTTCSGIVTKSNRGLTEVKFNSPYPFVILTRDLRCDTKNQQLQFAFML